MDGAVVGLVRVSMDAGSLLEEPVGFHHPLAIGGQAEALPQ
jgi:hypothetical protein